jgi:acyl-coenzyme A synthetase/AMP-(fatty) acid ligase
VNLYQSFIEVVTKHSQRVAIYDEKMHSENSYAKLKKDVDDFAANLSELGIRKDDRVLLLIPMSYKLYVALIALFKVGATGVFVDPSQSAAFVNHASLIAKPKALICSPKALLLKLKFRSLFKISLTITTRKIPFHHSMDDKTDKEYHTSTAQDTTPALMTFTSGSTGMPKAIVRTHHFLQTQYETLRPYINLKEGEVDLTGLPVFLLANLMSGMSSVIADLSLQNPKKINPDKLVQSMNRYKVQRVGASPALFEQLLQSRQKLQKEPEAFYIGGAPVLPSLLKKLHKVFHTTTLHVLYGSTEAEPISHYRFEMITDEIYKRMLRGEGLYVGKVVDEIALDFLDDGEIIVSGAHVVQSYYNNEGDAENKLLRDGVIWHKTGDIGKLDEDNNLWLLGRKSALIYKNGKIIHPFSIEVAMREKSQKMAALIEKNGEVILYTESDMLDLKFEGVDKIIHTKKIPLDRRHNAKVDYVALGKL